MQPHTNNLTDPSIAMDDITDIDSDSDIRSGSDEAVDDIRDIDSNPDILSGPEEEEESDIASFNEDECMDQITRTMSLFHTGRVMTMSWLKYRHL